MGKEKRQRIWTYENSWRVTCCVLEMTATRFPSDGNSPRSPGMGLSGRAATLQNILGEDGKEEYEKMRRWCLEIVLGFIWVMLIWIVQMEHAAGALKQQSVFAQMVHQTWAQRRGAAMLPIRHQSPFSCRCRMPKHGLFATHINTHIHTHTQTIVICLISILQIVWAHTLTHSHVK